MSNGALPKEADQKARKSTTPNHLNAKTCGANRPTRSRAPLVRKCCACQASGSHKTDQKIPQKSSRVVNKITTAIASSVNQRKRCSSSTDTSTVFRKINSTQVVKNDCRNELEATTPVSACTSLAVRQRATNIAKKQAKGEQKREQTSHQTSSIRNPTKTPEQTKSKAAIPRKNLIKKFESAGIASSSKQPSKKINSNTTSTKLDKSSLTKQPRNKELKERPSLKEVPKKKDESTALKGKLKVFSEVHSVNTGSDCSSSDCSSDSDDDDLHITWDGFEEDYKVAEKCSICDKGLSVRPMKEDGYETEFSTLPVSAVLPCGHVFHQDCLGVVERDCSIPLCVFCETLFS